MRFEDCLRLAGLLPREIVADGRLRRCATESKPRKRNGWYVLHVGGRRGAYGDNAIAPRQALGHWTDESSTTYQPSAAELDRQRQARERERQYRLQAMRGARTHWERAQPLSRPHPYIANKGLTPHGCAGLRTHDGQLVVPVWMGDWITSVQSITADGAKRFWPGAPVKAGAYLVDRPRAAVTCIVEGLATGLAVFQSVRSARVVVAFDGGNLLPVVQRLKPTGSVVICGDNDAATARRIGHNPGVDAATNAADLIGAGVACPEGIEGTDWADALREWGEGAQRRIERLILARARYVTAAPVP